MDGHYEPRKRATPDNGDYAGGDPVSFALSPDGRQIVFVAAGDGALRLWLRALGATTAQPLAGTNGASRREEVSAGRCNARLPR